MVNGVRMASKYWLLQWLWIPAHILVYSSQQEHRSCQKAANFLKNTWPKRVEAPHTFLHECIGPFNSDSMPKPQGHRSFKSSEEFLGLSLYVLYVLLRNVYLRNVYFLWKFMSEELAFQRWRFKFSLSLQTTHFLHLTVEENPKFALTEHGGYISKVVLC